MSALLFLHGVGGGRGAWDAQVAFFSQRGYRAVAWDQPGYGDAPLVDPYDLENVAGALEQTIMGIAGEPVVLVGHSMGGFIAQEAYARFPQRIRALVLCFTSPAFGGKGGEFAREFVAARIGPLDAGETMAAIASRLMPAMRGAISDAGGLAHAQAVMSNIPAQTYRKAVQLLTTFDRRALLPQISVPALLVAGSDDRTAPASGMERMAQKMPRAEYVCLPGCGHLGPMDQPEAFNAALLAFVQRHSL